ncbi:MAG: PAS domain S-box protein [Gemmatimonadota bacterium]
MTPRAAADVVPVRAGPATSAPSTSLGDAEATDALYGTLMGVMAEGVAVHDDRGRIAACNAAAGRILGVDPAGLVGRAFSDPDWRTVQHDGRPFTNGGGPVERVLETGRPVREVLLGLARADRSRVWIALNAELIQDAATGAVTVLTTFHDVTSIREATEALRRTQEELNSFFTMSLDMLCIGGFEGRYLRVNPAFTETLGFSEETLLRRPFLKFIHPADINPTVEQLRRLANGEMTLRFENRHLHKDGHYVWLSWSARPDGAGRIHALARDVTQQREAQAALQQYAEHLERSNSALEQFAFAASHDLQEPLRTVSSYARLLDERYRGRLDGDGDEFLHYLTDAADRMRLLVQDLLSYARLGRQGAKRQPVDGGRMLANILNDLDTAIREAGAVVEVGPLPVIEGDATQLGLVMQNLIGNAIKFHSKRPPHVRVQAREQEDGWEISVADNGVGIPAEHREKVFEVFKRLHSRKRFPGTGIGLAICRRIVEDHGGRIWVEAGVSGGSVFRFTIPRASEGRS